MNKEKKKHFDNFIEEIQTLNVRVTDGFLDLRHYSQDGSYPSEIVRLQQLAINDVLLWNRNQIQQQLKRLERIKRQFNRFWDAYKKLAKDLRENQYDNTYLALKIYPCFIVPNHERGSISERFMNDLHDAAAYKDGTLAGFEEQIKQVLEPENNDTEIEPVEDSVKDSILKKMQELVDSGYSDNKAAKMVSEEFSGIRSDSTIKKWFRGYI